jgi:uncharacterized membrane protein YphA (DoxX/SURF4 family)
MNTMLWIAQALLAVTFASSGVSKSLMSKERMLATGQTGVKEYSLPVIRFVAAAELFGAVGIVLPWTLQVAPLLTPLAAAGLGVIMIGAARAHGRLHEPRNVATNLVLLSLCVFVTLGRLPGNG